jgi:hypothetical protein
MCSRMNMPLALKLTELNLRRCVVANADDMPASMRLIEHYFPWLAPSLLSVVRALLVARARCLCEGCARGTMCARGGVHARGLPVVVLALRCRFA